MSGTITQLQRDRGVGTLLGEDHKSYMFRRTDVRGVWFHDLMYPDGRPYREREAELFRAFAARKGR